MGLYRKKPIVIEAMVWRPGASIEGVFEIDGHAYIETLEGRMNVSEGDWVITGVQGERYPCKPAIFDATYEAVNP